MPGTQHEPRIDGGPIRGVFDKGLDHVENTLLPRFAGEFS